MKQCLAENQLTFSLAQFLSLTLGYISDTLDSPSSENKGSHWRVIEIFLSPQNWQQNVGVEAADVILGAIFFFLSGKGED